MDPLLSMQQTPPEGPPQPSMSPAARLLNVIAAPGEVFAEIKATPLNNINWLIPAFLLIVVSWVGAALVLSQESFKHQIREVTARAVEQQIQKMHLPPDKAEQARQQAEKWAEISTSLGTYSAPIVVGFVSPFWWGLIIWLVGAKVLKGGFPFMKAVETAGLSNVILVLDAIIRTLLMLATGNLFASPSLVLLVKDFDPQNPTHALLGAINAMTFWVLAVRSVAIGRLSSVPFWKAAAWLFGLWAAYTGCATALSAALAKLVH